MKAVVIQSFGAPSGLTLVDLPDPKPAPGEALVAVEAIGVGGVDAVIRSGRLGDWGFQEGHVLGSEVAGTVTEVGDGVDAAWVGRRVWAFTGTGGGYAEQVAAASVDLVELPERLSAVDAVTLGSSGVVAHFGLRHAKFAPGESVLVRGAAGGIGVMAVQLAARAGAAAVAVTASSPERGERLRRIGATEVLDRSGGTSDGYDVVFDIVAGDATPSFFDKLAPNGRMVIVGAVAGFPPADFAAPMIAAFRRSLSFATFSADTVSAPDRQAAVAEMFTAATRGELEPIVHEVLPLHRAAQAHQSMESGAMFGRIALTAGD